MNRRLSVAALFSFLLAAPIAGCASSPPPSPQTPAVAPPPAPPPPPAAPEADESFRKTAPSLGPDVTFVAPSVQEKKLKNGVRILVVERHDLPVVALHLAFDRGADQDKPGVGGFTGAMLLQGTKKRSALELSDDLARLGASANSWVDYDSAHIALGCLSAKFEGTLALAADVAMHPAFTKDEIERLRSQRLTAIAQQRDRPSTVLTNTVEEVLYPAAHPYSVPTLGTADAVKKITAADLVRFHDEAFRPTHLTIAVAGDVHFDDVVAQVEKAFGSWKGDAPKEKITPVPPAPKSDDPRVILVDRPGATQSQVSLVLVGPPRSTKDYDALEVLNSIFGGAFSSRLNMNLREAHAYTYGAGSHFEFRHGPGPFFAGGAIVREKTGPAVTEIVKELDRIRTEPVTDAELVDAKGYIVKSLPGSFETVAGTAGSLARLAIYGLPLDEYATLPARIGRVTADDVKRVAATYLLPGYRVVVVGDAKVVQAQLNEVGLGAVSLRAAPADDEKKGDDKKGDAKGKAVAPTPAPAPKKDAR